MQLPADAAELAAASGSVPMLRLLHLKGVTFTSSTSCQAAASGHLGALQFLYNKDYVIGWDAVCAAAERGHLALLRFLHGVGYNMSHRRVVRAAVVGGSVEVMAWLLEHGVERTAELLYRAATSYHKLLFAFLYEQGCPWSVELTEFYLEHDDLHSLEWAVLQGVEFTAEQQQRYSKRKRKQAKQQRHYDKLEAKREEKYQRKLACAAAAKDSLHSNPSRWKL
eukprot:953-Heterococcus_DN1.PRE.4